MEVDASAGTRLLDKLKVFASELDDEERQLLAALLAPGVARSWQEESEVEGFIVDWLPSSTPEALRAAIVDRGFRIEGL